MKNLTALIEGILFASTEPVSSEALSAFFGIDEEEILTELIALQKTYEKDHHGFRLVRHEKDFRFSTKPDLGEDIALFLAKKRPQLSNAALEVLAIAAYNQPVTKPYISQIRGVSSAEVVSAAAAVVSAAPPSPPQDASIPAIRSSMRGSFSYFI